MSLYNKKARSTVAVALSEGDSGIVLTKRGLPGGFPLQSCAQYIQKGWVIPRNIYTTTDFPHQAAHYTKGF
jgi:hypothetical protein